MTQGLLGRVVGWLDAVVIHERPQVVLVFDEFFAKAIRQRVAVTAQQKRVDRLTDRLHAAVEGGARHRPVAHFFPEREHFERGFHQVAAEAFAGLAGAVDQPLEIAFKMSPAPLQPAEAPIHAGSIAVDDASKRLTQKFLQHVGTPTGAAGEERERRGHDGPDPGFGVAFLGRRLVDVRRRLLGKLSGEFVISGLDGLGDVVLQFDQPTGARGLIQNHAHELSGPSLRLAKTGHEHASEGNEPRPGLAGGHALGKLAAGAQAARADEPMPLILGDDRFEFGKFPDLVPQGLGIDAGERFATAAALAGNARDDFATLFGRKERPLVFFVAGLAATRTFGIGVIGILRILGILGPRLVMRMRR